MNNICLKVYKTENVIPLSNDDYYYYLMGKINNAKYRVYASIFIINSLISKDVELKVRDLIKNLAYAKWRNVDVRIIFGNSKNCEIKTANETTARYMHSLGISVKQYESLFRSSLHSKYVIIDDELIILGSHNWSNGAFAKNLEDSVAIYSKELNTILNDEFHKLWKTGINMEEIL